MSSSNSVRVVLLKESSYGVTPGSGNFSTVRFTSEALSGTPGTVESEQIRTDRMSSGQVVTSLAVAGDMAFELAKESAIDSILESLMYSSFDTFAPVTVDLTINIGAKTISRASGSFITDTLKVGDFITLIGMSNAVNNVQVMITSVVALTLGYVGPSTMVNEAGSGTSYDRANKIGIGTTKTSFSMEKTFLDLTTKAILYRGMICSKMDINFAYGELAKGSFGFSGNDYLTVDTAADFMTFGRTINAPATSQTLNGSVDMPFLANNSSGAFLTSGLAIQSISISLDNNLNAQNVIGDIAPIDYSAGTAAIKIDIAVYNNDASWDLLSQKLLQTPFSIGFQVKNADGWYGFYLPQVQVSFEDPSSGGQNQDIILTMSGTAKVGATGESAMTIYHG